ncbi:MAG: RecX family transcriptional regulator [Simkania negevensis]|nr:RecX family transcriptional regulator [Simkania negevensis]
MKIKLVEDAENKSLIKIFCDEELVRIFDKKLYLRYLNKIKNFLFREDVEAFFQLEEGKTALRYVYNLLAIKDHTKSELRRKLMRKKISAIAIEEVLEKVIEQGYVKEKEILKIFIESELKKGHGPAWIKVRLGKKMGKAEGKHIEVLFKAYLPDELQREKIKELIEKRTKRGEIGQKREEKLYRFLKGRGFEDRLILPFLKLRY